MKLALKLSFIMEYQKKLAEDKVRRKFVVVKALTSFASSDDAV